MNECNAMACITPFSLSSFIQLRKEVSIDISLMFKHHITPTPYPTWSALVATLPHLLLPRCSPHGNMQF